MVGLIVRRLLQLPLILAVIYTLTLGLAWAIPGNPLENPEGRQPPPEVRAAMQAQYNLDNFWKFYVSYLDSASGLRYVRDAATGRLAEERASAAKAGVAPPERYVFDLGPSLHYRDRRVNEIVASSLPVSISLGGLAILIALLIGVGAGVVGAVRPNSFADLATLSIALVGISLPSFVIGTVLLLIFGVWARVVPVAIWEGLRAAILPALTLSLPFAAYIARLTRMGMIDCLNADYIRTARAKGVAQSAVLFKHALKNAFLPVLSYLGPATALAMTGSFIVERVFNVPGMGLLFATGLVLFNLAVDVLYRWIDPRIE